MSQLSCFLEILVQLRSRETGCRRMMPLSIKGVMDLQWFRSMRVHNRLSQHLGARPSRGGKGRVGSSLGVPPAWLWSVPRLPSPRGASLTVPSGAFCLASICIWELCSDCHSPTAPPTPHQGKYQHLSSFYWGPYYTLNRMYIKTALHQSCLVTEGKYFGQGQKVGTIKARIKSSDGWCS